ncbi:peroxiredoxin family protein [Elizabethkingia anophelis]|uniref:Alkyl hydroperoxide reductase n=1 Tax=Elizabethkingia anophelis TaxID=1117645 RepID=A0AAE4NY70_9FLAO|nr:redoxin domain-containing protein [Elizabethkingia anophelis]MDV3663357.1 alkyl hydroperoxide reductase [Elizabethkingia anophelis]
MNKKKLMFLFFGIISIVARAQSIGMNFPYFAGKNYDFVIFQGDTQKTVYKGVIPENGKFTLNIPKEYAPYNGMSRWLITGTAEGGGLDMYIPGKDFSVSCTEAQPNEKNIIYKNNKNTAELTEIHREQTIIISRYNVMQQAVNIFTSADTNFPVFQQEYKKQIQLYNNFQQSLKKYDYIGHFLQIVNITKGISNHLTEKEEDKAKNTYQYITDELDWTILYTSGHWSTVVNTWLDIHTQVIKDPKQFAADFQKISNKISSPAIYTNLTKTMAHYLSQQGQDEYIGAIAPIIKASGKVSQYDGELTAYTKATLGSKAPDLIIPQQETNNKKQSNKTQILKIADKNYQQTLLFFYQSTDCKTCDQQLQELSSNYQMLTAKGVRVITISADKEKALYTSKSKAFPWKDAYCDYKGEKGENFKNYSVTGAPTLILIDSGGNILSRGTSISF